MKHFDYLCAPTYEKAAEALAEGKKEETVIMAGGTDLLGSMKERILPSYPKTVVALSGIPDASYISEESDDYRIGAMTKLSTIENDESLLHNLTAVAEAAHSVASPLIRNRATIGGNLCQDVRCWFYRYPDSIGGALNCARKGGEMCYAVHGDNRYHSIYGGMKVGLTSCSVECPNHTDIPGYMEQLRQGNIEAAAKIFMQVNPMPMITGRVCAHTCQLKCNQCTYGEGLNIHACERSLGDYVLAHPDVFYPKPEKETGKKVCIVGAGPGGLTAAYYLRKAGHDVTVYDMMEKPGGVMRYGIPLYRLPKKYCDDLAGALENMGIKFVMNTKVGQDITVEKLQLEYDSMFLGTGAWKQPILGIEGERLAQFGLNFLVEVNTFLKGTIGSGNSVLVCGGGNVAMDVALTAKRLGAKKVILACLEKLEEMPASPEEVNRAKEEGVQVINSTGLSRIVSEDGKVKGLETKKCVSVRDENGRFHPTYDENDKGFIESDCIILATGQRVDLDFLGEKFASEIKSKRGLIDVDLDSYKTNHPGIYAGGDVVSGPSVAVKAIYAGRIAAQHMSRDLGYPLEDETIRKGFLHFDPAAVKKTEAVKETEHSLDKRNLTDEDVETIDDASLIEESKRCMNCGCYSVNASDLSPVMVALDATLKTTKKTVKAIDFFTTTLKATDMLDKDEIVREIIIPKLDGYVSSYKKFRMRDSIDFAMASIAYAYKMENGRIGDIRIVLGGVAPVPLKLVKVEELLTGKVPGEEIAEEAAELAVDGAAGIGHNDYKVDEVKTFIKRMVMSMV